MGAGGVPNRTCEIIDGRPGDLPICGAKPNSRYDLYVKGKRYQLAFLVQPASVYDTMFLYGKYCW